MPDRASGYSPTTRAPFGPVTIMPRTGTATARRSARSSRPSSSASDPGFTVSPHSLSRGNRARSINRTRAPARARISAAMLPAGPAPTTTTSVDAAKDQRRILGAEPEAVAQRGVDLRLARLPRDEIHVAGGVGIVEIDRGWQDAVGDRQGRCRNSGGAARALGMADHRFDGRARHTIGVRAEHAAHAARLDRVVQLRGGTVV